MTFEQVFFVLVAVVALTTAILMIVQRNPIVSVLFLIANFFSIAIIYLFLQAQFIAIIQILVYAGAIMVLFLFVIMLLNLREEQLVSEKINFKKILIVALASIIFIEIILAVVLPVSGNKVIAHQAAEIGTVEYFGKTLFTDFVFPFEIISILLLAAMVGVIILAKKRFD